MAKASLTLTKTPFPAQIPFFEATARHIGYGGARGGGKSWAMRRKFVLLALAYPNLSLLLLRRTLPELEGNHIKPLMKELYGYAKYNTTKHEFLFPNGSTIKCGYCDSEADTLQFQGQEYQVIGLEEATQFTERQRDDIKLCNRGVRTDGFTPRMYYTCNPGGVGHDWVKRLFINKIYDPDRNENPDDYVFFPAKVTDNPALMESDPGYIRELQALPPERRRAMLDGDWDVLEGQYFEEFRRSKHVCEPFDIPVEWKRFRSMDWGFNDPTAVYWYALAPDGHVYVYDEIYRNKTLVQDMAALIREKTGTVKISATVGSPDMWQKRGLRTAMQGESVAEEFAKRGITIIPADNSRIVGWQRVRAFLADAPDGVPWLQIFPNCRDLIRTFPMIVYDQHDKEDVSDKCEDHACLTGDTLVCTTDGNVPIRDLVGKSGRVYCFDEESAMQTVSTFHDVRMTRHNADVYEVTLEDGSKFRGTGDHKVLTDIGGWKMISELTESDSMVNILTQTARVLGVERVSREDVYNMEVDNFHNFAINNGAIVHNCESLRYFCMSRPAPNKDKIIQAQNVLPFDPFSTNKREQGGFLAIS